MNFSQPLLSPHHPLKSPFINSSSEGELSDEYIVVGNQAKAGMQMPVVNTPSAVNRSKQDDSTSDNTNHHNGTAVTMPTQTTPKIRQPLAAGTHDNNTVLLSSQLEQVGRDLQSILNRLNSLEVLLQRRRVR